jgi:hypothetical protein
VLMAAVALELWADATLAAMTSATARIKCFFKILSSSP